MIDVCVGVVLQVPFVLGDRQPLFVMPHKDVNVNSEIKDGLNSSPCDFVVGMYGDARTTFVETKLIVSVSTNAVRS